MGKVGLYLENYQRNKKILQHTKIRISKQTKPTNTDIRRKDLDTHETNIK